MRRVLLLFAIIPGIANAEFAPVVVNHAVTGMERTKANTIKSASVCTERHGQWFEEKVRYAFCVLPYADAGKQCQNSKDCIGHCIAPVTDKPIDHGTCQINDSTDNCGRPQYENGKVIYFNCD